MRYALSIFGMSILFGLGTGYLYAAWKSGPCYHGVIQLIVGIAIYASAVAIGSLVDEAMDDE